MHDTVTRRPPKARAYWSAMAAIVLLDVATKRAAEATLTVHQPMEVIGHWVRLTLGYNPGAAMNLSLGDFSRVGFSVVAVVMVVVLYRMYREAAPDDAWQSLALGMISGGALGNLIDRLRSARGVVDFIDVGTAGWRFWTFNVADSGVTVGAVLLVLIMLRRPGESAGGAPPPGRAPAE